MSSQVKPFRMRPSAGRDKSASAIIRRTSAAVQRKSPESLRRYVPSSATRL